MQSHVYAPMLARLRGRRLFISSVRCAAAVLLAASLAACASPPPHPIAGPDPSDPGAGSRPYAYRSVVGRHDSSLETEPSSWIEQNERVAPGARP
jgi:hypothetical protein